MNAKRRRTCAAVTTPVKKATHASDRMGNEHTRRNAVQHGDHGYLSAFAEHDQGDGTQDQAAKTRHPFPLQGKEFFGVRRKERDVLHDIGDACAQRTEEEHVKRGVPNLGFCQAETMRPTPGKPDSHHESGKDEDAKRGKFEIPNFNEGGPHAERSVYRSRAEVEINACLLRALFGPTPLSSSLESARSSPLAWHLETANARVPTLYSCGSHAPR